MSLPVILSYLIEFLNPFITNYSVGWLGKSELASSALSTMFANMTGFAFALGMTSCLETLCSQAYTGSRDIKLVGLFAQRGFFVSLVLFLPISAIWLKAEELLLLIGQEEELSRLCGVYLKWLLLAVPPFIGFECIKKYLQAQNIMNASAYILILSLPICVLCNYILVWHPALSIGFIGAPISLVISTWSSFLFSICYVLFIDGKQAWGGFTINAFKEWNIIIKLGIPGVIMLCSEWWTYEILAFCASYINTTSLAAHGSLGNLGTLFFQISIGTSAVASILIGNTLGLGDAKKAKKTSMNCIIVGSIHGLITCLFILLTSNYLKQFNNNDPQFVKILQNVLPVLALFQVSLIRY
ncbi:mate-domain-containing protein [Neoconidiobolus thromboides FSU 785]|nr:mate-domain-containing protein [Neoconidiobolus thromboides FSU 785]